MKGYAIFLPVMDAIILPGNATFFLWGATFLPPNKVLTKLLTKLEQRSNLQRRFDFHYFLHTPMHFMRIKADGRFVKDHYGSLREQPETRTVKQRCEASKGGNHENRKNRGN